MNRTYQFWYSQWYFGEVSLPYWGFNESEGTRYHKIGYQHENQQNWTYLYVRTWDNAVVFSELRTNDSYQVYSTVHYF